MTRINREIQDSIRTEFRFSRHLIVIVSEFLFILLPLIIVIIIFINNTSWRDIFVTPEWSFAAAILLGQSIVKLVSGIASRGRETHWQNVAFIVSLMIVLGLAPSLIILSLMLTTPYPSMVLIIAQMIYFLIGSLNFIAFGTLGQYYLSH